jgi:hypothetical protein
MEYNSRFTKLDKDELDLPPMNVSQGVPEAVSEKTY